MKSKVIGSISLIMGINCVHIYGVSKETKHLLMMISYRENEVLQYHLTVLYLNKNVKKVWGPGFKTLTQLYNLS